MKHGIANKSANFLSISTLFKFIIIYKSFNFTFVTDQFKQNIIILMNTISQITPQLYIGTGKHARLQSDDFLKLNIDVIINCCNDFRHKQNNKYVIEEFPIDDGFDARIGKYLDKIADTINNYILQNKIIYIHCVQGRSRSATIVIYYFMKYHKMRFVDAYNKLLQIRPCVSPNINFINELIQMDKYLFEQ
ncbi:dual specificity protein phosphatase 14 [Tupanvirus soda lake]|uniref:Dual specificity protein phosphatase 14 n=2 Tax=Tupanvirus TaxID=2094720 RepID=A0A6N1NZF3_9VIRU|nr:dual specificity protein phosphatase 14 [Tupanvirus soda lake]QKU35312.1 dual specificity protein phosphatase 14 [Tupanvirus soda lake]